MLGTASESSYALSLFFLNSFIDTEIPPEMRITQEQIETRNVPSMIYFSKYHQYSMINNMLRIPILEYFGQTFSPINDSKIITVENMFVGFKIYQLARKAKSVQIWHGSKQQKKRIHISNKNEIRIFCDDSIWKMITRGLKSISLFLVRFQVKYLSNKKLITV